MAAACLTVREIESRDLISAATVLYNAFLEINRSVNAAAVNIDFASLDSAISAVKIRLQDECSAGVVAVEEGGAIVGLGFIVFGEVDSLALIAVCPNAANKGIGRKITSNLLKKSTASSVRLVQGAPNTKSFALYAKLGFRPVEYWSNFVGSISQEQGISAANAIGISLSGYFTRKMELEDVPACSRLFQKALGYNRESQIREKVLRKDDVLVILKDGNLVGFSTGFSRSGFTLTTSEESAIALYSAATDLHLYILGQLYPRLLRWAFEAHLSLIRHGSYMVLGSYQRPQNGMVWSLCGIS